MNFDPRKLRARRAKTSAGVVRKTIADHAVDVMIESGRRTICVDDVELIERIGAIAFRFGPHDYRKRWSRLSATLTKSRLFDAETIGERGRLTTLFTLKQGAEA